MKKATTGILTALFTMLFMLSGIIFPILGIVAINNNITWLLILSTIFSCYYIFINLLDGRIIELISAYIINLLILYIGNYSILEKYSIFLISLIEIPIIDYIYVLITSFTSRKKNINNDDNNVIESLMQQTNLSYSICQEIIIILNYFVADEHDNAYFHIENNLTQLLLQENNIGQVGIAFGLLIDEKALTQEQATYYSQKTMNDIVNNQKINN